MKTAFVILFFLQFANAFTQNHVYIDRTGKRYSESEVNRIHREDQFLSISNRTVKGDSIFFKIQYYRKEQVADRFQTEGDYCGNDSVRLSISEIKGLPFFTEVVAIKLASFDMRDPIGGCHFIPRLKGAVDLRKAKETVELSQEMMDKLLDVLVNYNNTSDEIEVLFCGYEPRNSIIFYGRKGKFLGALDLCFECWQHQASPEFMRLGTFCSEKYHTLQGFFRSAGIKYGTRYNDQ
jgi:hypothetical protein